MVKRYKITAGPLNVGKQVVDDGEWVKYAAHAAEIAALERALAVERARVARARDELDDYKKAVQLTHVNPLWLADCLDRIDAALSSGVEVLAVVDGWTDMDTATHPNPEIFDGQVNVWAGHEKGMDTPVRVTVTARPEEADDE